jgi:hypothetical protein
MANCGAGECSCECRNGCGCISSSDDPLDCDCKCFGGLRPPNFGVLQGVGPTTLINAHFRGVNAGEVAVVLSRALRVHLAVPTSLLKKRLSVKLKRTPVRAVIKRLGLVEIKRAPNKSRRKRSR